MKTNYLDKSLFLLFSIFPISILTGSFLINLNIFLISLIFIFGWISNLYSLKNQRLTFYLIFFLDNPIHSKYWEKIWAPNKNTLPLHFFILVFKSSTIFSLYFIVRKYNNKIRLFKMIPSIILFNYLPIFYKILLQFNFTLSYLLL